MAHDIVSDPITTNTDTFIATTIGQGSSISLSGQTAGTATVQKRLPNGTNIDITDENGAPLVISVFPTTVNIWVGAGCDISVKTESISGTLLFTMLPIKSAN